MKGSIKDRKTAVTLMAVIAVIAIVLMFVPGFAGDRQTKGRTVAYGAIKYGSDLDAIDRKALTEDIRATIGAKADVGITTNLANGFDNIVIEYDAPIDIDTAALKALFDSKYSDLGLEKFTAYKLSPERTAGSVFLEMLLICCCFCVSFAVYALITGRKIRFILTVIAVSVVSALASLALILIARIALGRLAVAAEISALISSALLCCWQLGNYSVLSGTRKKAKADTAAKAEGLGWTVTYEAAVFSVLALCGLLAGCLIAGRAGMFALALCVALPVIVSAFAAHLFAIKLFAD